MARIRFVLLTLALSALQLAAQTPKPRWEVDLSRFGYQGRPPAALLRVSHDSIGFDWAYQQGVVFTDADVVAAYFVVYDAPSGASEAREPEITDSFRLVAVFLNAENGDPIKQLDWKLPPDSVQVSPSYFYPAEHGRFVVILGNTVNLYSSDFKLIAQIETHGEVTPIPSPSGESILLRTFGRPTVKYDLLDTGNLSVLKSWNQPSGSLPRRIDSIWGDRLEWTVQSTVYIATAASEPKKPLAARPESCDTLRPGGNSDRFKALCDTEDNLLTLAGNLCGGWQLIGKDSLVGTICTSNIEKEHGVAKDYLRLSSYPAKLLTVSTEGKILHEFNLGLEGIDGSVVASADGRRFAIATTPSSVGPNDVPNRQTAEVFDLGSGNQVLTVDVPAHKDSPREFIFGNEGDTRFSWGGVALSPNGDRLALKSSGNVRVYSVPDEPPHPLATVQ